MATNSKRSVELTILINDDDTINSAYFKHDDGSYVKAPPTVLIEVERNIGALRELAELGIQASRTPTEVSSE